LHSERFIDKFPQEGTLRTWVSGNGRAFPAGALGIDSPDGVTHSCDYCPAGVDHLRTPTGSFPISPRSEIVRWLQFQVLLLMAATGSIRTVGTREVIGHNAC